MKLTIDLSHKGDGVTYLHLKERKLSSSGLPGKGERLTARRPLRFSWAGWPPSLVSCWAFPQRGSPWLCLPRYSPALLQREDAQANFTETSKDKVTTRKSYSCESQALICVSGWFSLRIRESPFTSVVKYQACPCPPKGLCVAPGFKCLDFNSFLLGLCLQSPFYISPWVPLILVAGFCKVCSCPYSWGAVNLSPQLKVCRGISAFIF